jgi:redox-sensitive bicupin YhaK (pirin superfamily)
MITVRKSQDRGMADHGWLRAKHTFSFARYVDRRHMHFRALRVINEDVVAPGAGFGEHPHDNMEIVTYVLSGTLAHKDSMGNVATIVPGEVQRMSAGSGLTHSEFNHSKSEPVHLLQIWLFPEREEIEPGYEQKKFSEAERRDVLRPIVTPDTREGSLKIYQDTSLYASLLSKGASVKHTLKPGRHAWLQLAKGAVTLNGVSLQAGDGAAVSEETAIEIRGDAESEFLLFDLA